MSGQERNRATDFNGARREGAGSRRQSLGLSEWRGKRSGELGGGGAGWGRPGRPRGRGLGWETRLLISLPLCSFWANRAGAASRGRRKQAMKLPVPQDGSPCWQRPGLVTCWSATHQALRGGHQARHCLAGASSGGMCEGPRSSGSCPGSFSQVCPERPQDAPRSQRRGLH